jgi:Xaa-Pro aminopeptidase
MNPGMAAAHRNAFMEAMSGGAAVLATGGERVRNRDVHYPFRPDSDFWYLTAFPEADAVAVLRPDADSERFVLFVRPKDPLAETWTGRRAGIEGAREHYGADAAYSIESLDTELPRLLRGVARLYYSTGSNVDRDRKILGWMRSMYTQTRDGVTGPVEVVEPGTLLHELRLRKSDDELALMRRAAEITDTAHRAAMAGLHEGMHEYEIEALVNATFRSAGGWGPGYPSICAAGNNATVLHYTTNAEVVAQGDLMLLDAGCEVEGYTADVTRCFPASGKFTDAQREMYEVVLAAQLAGCEQSAPGNAFHSVHDVTTRTLIAGMIDIGMLTGGVDEAMESESYKRWYMHRSGHWLGLDVHDVGSYYSNGDSRPLEPGMVLTVEPGIYVSADDAQAPERFRGLGIRIEDDILVTADGHENLTAAIPKTVDDVEATR